MIFACNGCWRNRAQAGTIDLDPKPNPTKPKVLKKLKVPEGLGVWRGEGLEGAGGGLEKFDAGLRNSSLASLISCLERFLIECAHRTVA